MSRPTKTQPLDGVTVLDFSSLLPGPLAALLLAEAGAEVIKIEPPAGDGMTLLGPEWENLPALYVSLNSGKSRVVIDLKAPAGRATLQPLLDRADVLIEQFRPGVMARLGLGYPELRRDHPGLIYCSITGYGQDGPWAPRAGHDLNYIGDSGILAMSPGAPSVPPVLAADIAGGSYPAVMNILLALLRRAKTGEGAHLDISMAECMLPFAFWALPDAHLSGRAPRPGQEWITGGSPRYRVYLASDGGLLCVAAIEQKFWEAFCKAIGLEPRFAATDSPPEDVICEIGRILGSRPAVYWAGVFDGADCCCTVARDLCDVVQSAHYQQRGMFDFGIAKESGGRMPALPLPLAPEFRRPAEELRQAPGGVAGRMSKGTDA